MLGRVVPQVNGMAVFGIGKLVDRLVADLQIAAIETQTARDLLGRPARLQPIYDDFAEVAMPDQLAQASPAGFGFGLRVQGVVAGEILELGIDEAVALQLAVDGV